MVLWFTHCLMACAGQPMILTLQQQVAAAGGLVLNSSAVSLAPGQVHDDADVLLLVNNFSEQVQVGKVPSAVSVDKLCFRHMRLLFRLRLRISQPLAR